MIIFLFKNCAWLQQFDMEIESFKWHTLNEKMLWKNQHVNGLLSSFSNYYNIRESYPISFIYAYISLKRSYKTPAKKNLIILILFRSYEHLKLYIIIYIFDILIIFFIYKAKHFLPIKFKSLPSKFRKCFQYKNEDKNVSGVFFMCILIVNV